MKRIIYIIFVLLPFVAQAQSEGRDPEKGQLMLADPYVLEDDGWYYIYGTHADDGIVVYRSRDLQTWSDRCGNAKNSLALHKDDVWGDFWFWAPEVYRVGDRFIMTYSCQEHICYAESDSPCGPFVQSEKRPYLPDEKGIDSHIFFDGDKAYIFWVRFEGPYGIWVAELTPDLREVKLSTARLILEPQRDTWEHVQAHVSEGPAILKHKGKYYMTYSCNDYQSKDYAVGVAIADNVLGPYERHPDNPILHRHAGYVGTGHHSLLKYDKGYYMVYHAHYNGEKIHPRQTLISPLVIKRDKSVPKQYVLSVSNELIVPLTK